MRKVLFLLVPFIVVLLIYISSALRGDSSESIIWSYSIEAFYTLLGLFYCFGALLHSVYYVESPQERLKWAIYTTLLNIFGSCYYYLTEYSKHSRVIEVNEITDCCKED